MNSTDPDSKYMERALTLASRGLGLVSPNPMVGAVIVDGAGRIVGEGYHHLYGGPHAEVNAVNSVAEADRRLLKDCTVYVTLEPCSHHGKTPPCADLLVEKQFRRVVIGTRDPFAKVDGTGELKLRDAGIEVRTGVLEMECRSLNARFFTAHLNKRPFVTLKWAQSADGHMDGARSVGEKAYRFSTPTGMALVHRLRSLHDAIGIGSGTALADSPLLNVRLWNGKNPRKAIFDRRGRLGAPTSDIARLLSELYDDGVTSILIEGGPTLLNSFIERGLWDLARVEVSPVRLGAAGMAKAPSPPTPPFMTETMGRNQIFYYSNNRLVNPFFVKHAL